MRKILLLFTFLTICSFNMLAQLMVDFSADITEGCVPLTVNFTDLSTSNGTITSWEWSFGNGNNSTQQNPTLIYTTAASTFEVCLTVTDDLVQTDTHCKTAFITTYGEPQISGIVVNVLCNGDSNGSIDITVTGGTEPYTFLWNDPGSQTSEDIIDLSAGTYSVFVTDANDCVSVENFTIDEPQPISFIYIDSSPISCFGACDGYYEIVGDGGWGNNYTYNWSNGSTTPFIDNICFGDYLFTITDENGCSGEWIYTMNSQPPELIVEEETPVQQISCIGADDGAIDIIVTGGTLPYTYLWSNGESTQDIFNLSPGVYTVTVTDANDCEAITVKTVVEPIPLSISSSIEEGICPGDCSGVISVLVSGGCGAYSYQWNNGANTAQIIDLCDGGEYEVTVTDCNGCTIIDIITLPDSPQPMVLDFTSTCPTTTEGGTIDVSVSGGAPPYMFLWLPGLHTTQSLIDFPPGIYTITVEDSNGCTIEESIELGDGIENIIGGDTVYCDGDQIQLFVDAPDAVSYNWIPTGQLSCSDCPDPVLTVDLGGNMTYLVSIVESDDCIDEALITFSVQSYLDFNLLEFSNSPVIEGNELELYCNVFNPISVEWTGPDNFTSTDCNPVITSADIGNEGEYALNIIDEYGCETTATTDVNILTIIDSISENSTICEGGSIELLVVAPDAVSVEWTPYASLDNPTSLSPIASPTETTTYTVTAEDTQGNQETMSVTILVLSSPEIALVKTCATPGQDNGALKTVVTGGLPPYTYFWSNGATTADLANLSTGFYYGVTVTDDNGCSSIEGTFMNGIILSIIDTVDCNGTVPIYVDAPSAVSFNWEPAAFLDDPTSANPVATISSPTTFSLTVTNAEGCEDFGQTEAEAPDDLVIELQAINATCGQNNGIVNILFLCGFSGPYTYDWEPNVSTTYEAVDLGPGVYSVTVTDDQGNTGSASAELFAVELGVIINGRSVVCEDGLLSLCAGPNNGTSSSLYSFEWSGPGDYTISPSGNCLNNPDATFDNTGCYSVTMTDALGCSSVAVHCLEVFEEYDQIVQLTENTEICAGESILLELENSGTSPAFFYTWTPSASLSSPSAQNPIATPTETTTYVVSVWDGSGCATIDSVTITVLTDCVWPGDTDTTKVVDNFDLLNIGLAYDSVGPLRQDATIGWYAQFAPDWPQIHPGIDANFKHIDTNGDGVINADDTLAIIQNWGQFHNFAGDDPDELLETVSAPFYVEPDTLIEGESHVLSVILGDMNDQINELYGLAFSLEYDPEVIVPGSASMAFNAGWIGTKGIDMIAIQKTFISPGRVDIGLTRINGLNMSGFGEIGQFYITIEDDILFQSGDDDSRGVETIDTKFKISNVRLINNLGEVIPVIPMETTAVIDEVVGTQKIDWEQYIQVQPNPAKDEFL